MGALLAKRLGQWLFPLPEGYAESGTSLEELRKEFRRWELWGLAAFLLGWAVCAFGVWCLLQGVALWNAGRYGPSVYHLCDTKMILALASLPVGIVSSGLLLSFGYYWLLQERYAQFIRYTNLTAGYDTNRFGTAISGLVGLLATVLILTSFSWHVVFRQEEVTFHSWCGLGTTTKRYSEVADIRTAPQLRAPNRRLVNRREYEIEFDDGSVWTTNFEPGNLSEKEKGELASFVSTRAKKPIRQLRILE
ncbi:MAG TPA: hypothetical protein VGJ26_03780 [Pirellulales bacterium]|jgi:hypothetical protein